jgi:hypothetical protein
MDIKSFLINWVMLFLVTYSVITVLLIFRQDNVTNKDLATSIFFSLIAILLAFSIYHKQF